MLINRTYELVCFIEVLMELHMRKVVEVEPFIHDRIESSYFHLKYTTINTNRRRKQKLNFLNRGGRGQERVFNEMHVNKLGIVEHPSN